MRYGFFELFTDSVKNAVDKDGGLAAAVSLGDLDGLIDDDRRRDELFLKELEHGDPQDIAVDEGHPRDPPVLGISLDQGIDFFFPGDNPPHQPIGVLLDLPVHFF